MSEHCSGKKAMTDTSSLRVSIVTAVRNAHSTIGSCLDSVEAQSYLNRQHVLIDGLSTDGTIEVIRGRSDRVDVFISERDAGIYNALNKGIARSDGDVVGFLHADDVFAHKDVLAKVAEAFREPEIGVVYGDLQYVSKSNIDRTVRYWRAGEFSPGSLARGWMPPHPTLYVRRSIYGSLGGFDESYRIAADYDYVLRIFARHDVRAAYIPDVLVKMRVGGISNASLRSVFRKSAEDYRALRRHRVGGVLSLLAKNVRKVRQFIDSPG